MGYQQAHSKAIPEDAVRVVLLLSDGHANEGIVEQGQLSKLALDAFQDGIQTSSFGLGSDYDGPLMSAIAADGAGGYYYLRDSEQIAPALTAELDKRLDPVATAVEVRVRFKKGRRAAQCLRLSKAQRGRGRRGPRPGGRRRQAGAEARQDQENRKEDQEGGMRFFIPAFARDDSHALLLKLRLPAGRGQQAGRPRSRSNTRIASPRRTSRRRSPSPSATPTATPRAGRTDPSVLRTIQGFAGGRGAGAGRPR
jgi:Ca-activated chloride channel family protein